MGKLTEFMEALIDMDVNGVVTEFWGLPDRLAYGQLPAKIVLMPTIEVDDQTVMTIDIECTVLMSEVSQGYNNEQRTGVIEMAESLNLALSELYERCSFVTSYVINTEQSRTVAAKEYRSVIAVISGRER